MKRFLLMMALLCTAIGLGAYAHPLEGNSPPRVIAAASEWSGFVDNVDAWGFSALLVTPSPATLESRFIGAQVGNSFVPGLGGDKNEWVAVASIDEQAETPLGEYEKWHALAVEELAADDEVERDARARTLAEKVRKNYAAARKKAWAALEEAERRGAFEKGRGAFEVSIPSVPLNPGETVTVELVFEVREVRAQDGPGKSRRITVPTSVTELAFPPEGIEDNSTWIRGDLHIHSLYSDGDQNLYSLRDQTPNLRGRGYQFVYMTDHVGSDTTRYLQRSVCLCPVGPGMPPPCNATSTWQCYVTNAQRVSLPEIAFFPGAEINTRPDTWFGTASGGHALLYGMNSLRRHDNNQLLFCGTLSGPELVQAAPRPCTLGVAHPTTPAPGFQWIYPIRDYRGVELMTPFDWRHNLDSSETQWWLARAFTPVALSDAVNGRGVLSVRTGSDFHEGWHGFAQYYTHVLIPSTWSNWQTAPWSMRQQEVDGGLTAGRAIASHRGGWGRVAVNGVMPGGVVRSIPQNQSLSFNVRFIPCRTGSYNIRVFRNNDTGNPIYSESVWGTAGVEITRNFTRSFPGGTHGYWLYVGGSDDIYSTHVVVADR
jgi:hypothetical protein